MFRVVLVDDEQVILNGLNRVFPWDAYRCQVVGTALDGLSGLALVRQHQPNILFTDIRMPNMNGLAMIAALKSEFPQMQISILTAFREFEYAQRAIQLGVSRYLLKPSKMEELKEAVVYMTASLRKKQAAAQEGASEEAPLQAQASDFVVNTALAYIREHYARHISLSEVADSVYVSQWHLSKLINRHLNKSFFDLLNELRVEEAKKLLKNPALRVHEVADQVGFADVAHFSKTFKRLAGRSPVEYRSRCFPT